MFGKKEIVVFIFAAAASIKKTISFLPNILFPLKNENAILPLYYGGF